MSSPRFEPENLDYLKQSQTVTFSDMTPEQQKDFDKLYDLLHGRTPQCQQ